MKTILPSRSARRRTGRCGASGLHLSRRAAFHSGSAAARAAAASAPTKFGIRSSMGKGKRAMPRADIARHTRSRIFVLDDGA